MGENFFSQQGYDGQQKAYQVIHHLGEENSTTGIDLQGMKSNPNINFALGRDIDAGVTQTWRGNSSFYRGFECFNKSNDFEGLGHKIYNNLNGSLFDNFSNGKISNVHLEVLDNNKDSFDYGGGMLAIQLLMHEL